MTKEQNYCVYCHTCPDGMQYFGVTCNIKTRWYSCHYKGLSLEPYIDKFGWESIKHEILFSDLTHTEALKIEDSLIKEGLKTGTCLNMNRSGGNRRQTDEFREEEKAYQKAWREANPDYNKSYYEANKDKILARRRERYKNKKK